MTMDSPARSDVNKWRNVVLGVSLTLITIISSWLLVGKGWLETRGSDERQAVDNTERITKLEDQAKDFVKGGITRTEHQDLIDRISHLEMVSPTRVEVEAQMAGRDSLLRAMVDQLKIQTTAIDDLRVQVGILQTKLEEHDRQKQHAP